MKLLKTILTILSKMFEFLVENWLLVLMIVGFSTQFFIGKDNKVEQTVEELYLLKTGEDIDLSPEPNK